MAEKTKSILLLGCFDTKGEDFHFLRDCILAEGESVISVNTGVMGTTLFFQPDIESTQVAREGGSEIQHLRKEKDRGFAVDIMSKGAARIVANLVAEGKIKAAIGMGGGGGTYIALSAMQQIPLGIPKLCLTTVASKDLSRQVGNKDITLMPSIVDVAGLNSISKRLMRQAAAAICAMANVVKPADDATAGSIAISMFGNTTPCVDKCRTLLQQKGFEVFIFHATGVGGRTMESLIREGCFDGVLDITTTELADDLCGGICSAGPGRLDAAAEMGIPQVVVPGCLDMVNFAQPDTVPERYASRKLYSWAPDVTLMRTNEEENEILGERLAQKLNRAKAPATIVLPQRGLSQIDAEGCVFYHPEINAVLFRAIKKHTKKPVRIVELDAHINDEKFAETLVETIFGLIENKKSTKNYYAKPMDR